MAEGPNDGEWQVGLVTHEGNAAEDPVFTGLGADATRVKPRSAAAKGPNPSWRSQHPTARLWSRLHVGVQA
jgi:hypothetical protein